MRKIVMVKVEKTIKRNLIIGAMIVGMMTPFIAAL